MQSAIKSLKRRFEVINSSNGKKTFIPALFQYLKFATNNKKISQILKELEKKRNNELKKLNLRQLPFLEETEIWPHWGKIEPALLLSGKSYHKASETFLEEKRNDSVLDFLHFRAGNNSFNGAPTNEQLANLMVSIKIVHNFLLDELEKVEPEKTLVTEKNGDFYYNNFLINFGEGTQYKELFKIIYTECSNSKESFISYKKISLLLDKRTNTNGPIKKTDRQSSQKKIQNLIRNGIFRTGKLANKSNLENITPSGKKLIEIIRGKGIKLNQG